MNITLTRYLNVRLNYGDLKGEKMKSKIKQTILFVCVWICLNMVVLMYGGSTLMQLMPLCNLLILIAVVITLILNFMKKNFGTNHIVQQNKEMQETIDQMKTKMDEMQETINQK